MFDLTLSAFRIGDTIHATVHATLPDGCHQAEITDIYPGGNIVHVVDPGHAEIYVTFTRRDGPCTQAIREWSDSRDIPFQNDYREVVAHAEFGEQRFSARGVIQPFRLAQGADIDPGFNPGHFATQFVVVALTGSQGPKHVGCRVVHEDDIVPAIFSRVHGPASRAECQQWVADNCVGAADLRQGADGGGQGAFEPAK